MKIRVKSFRYASSRVSCNSIERRAKVKSMHHCTLWLMVILVYCPVSYFGQTSTDNWKSLQTLKPGTRISIETINGDVIKGKFQNVSDTTITVSTDNRQTNVRRDDVRRIFRHGGSPLKSVAIGAAIGAGAGAGGAGALLGATGGSDSTNQVFAIGIAVGAGIGVGIGALFGSNKKRLVYQGP